MKFISFTKAMLAAFMASALFPVLAMERGSEETVSFTEGEAVTFRNFDGLALKGGGEVTVIQSETFSVTVVSGGDKTELVMDGRALKIQCPERRCKGKLNRVVEVKVPTLDSIAIVGGGLILIEEGFDPRGDLSVAVVGGGKINAYNLSANDVSAAVTGGGSINITTDGELSAAVIGGGSITYDGEPEVSRSIIGGGSVRSR